jgi:hypothetical protein
MSDDIHAEARERYERATEALIRRGWVTRADLKSEMLGQHPRPIYFSPLRNSLVIREAFAAEKRAAEVRDRREWIEEVRRRLGLVAEVHRPRLRKTSPWSWGWHCQRSGCAEAAVGCMYLKEAFGDALAHARAFVPEVTDLVNERFAGDLPDEMCFEWVADGE